MSKKLIKHSLKLSKAWGCIFIFIILICILRIISHSGGRSKLYIWFFKFLSYYYPTSICLNIFRNLRYIFKSRRIIIWGARVSKSYIVIINNRTRSFLLISRTCVRTAVPNIWINNRSGVSSMAGDLQPRWWIDLRN